MTRTFPWHDVSGRWFALVLAIGSTWLVLPTQATGPVPAIGWLVEPLLKAGSVRQPVALAADEQGRLWCLDRTADGSRLVRFAPAQPPDRAGTPVEFARLPASANGLLVLRDGALVAAGREVWWLRDRDGDSAAEWRTNLLASLPAARLDGTLIWSQDNSVRGAGGNVELVCSNAVWQARPVPEERGDGLAEDETGREFRCSPARPLTVNEVPRRYLRGNPNFRPSGYWDRPLAETNAPDAPAWSALLAPASDALPPDWRDGLLAADPGRGEVVFVRLREADGFMQRRTGTDADVLLRRSASGFRPVALALAADGALLVADADPAAPQIWRMTLPATGRRRTFAPKTPVEWAARLGNESPWWRSLARLRLVEEAARLPVTEVKLLAGQAQNPEARIAALRTLAGTDQMDADTLAPALEWGDAPTRRVALRLAEAFAGLPAQGKLNVGFTDLALTIDVAVQLQFLRSAGAVPGLAGRLSVMQAVYQGLSSEAHVDAVVGALTGEEFSVATELIEDPRCGVSPLHLSLLGKLAGCVRRTGSPEQAAGLVTLAGKHVRGYRETSVALLEGFAAAGEQTDPRPATITLPVAPPTWPALATNDWPEVRRAVSKARNQLRWPEPAP